MTRSGHKPCVAVVAVLFLLAMKGLVGDAPAQAFEAEGPPWPERGLRGVVTPERLPAPEHELLVLGQKIWGQNCQVCHGSGLSGAPKITSTRSWKKRIAKGLPTLFDHAKNGFEPTMGGVMPARGGNKDLTDQEVESAVRFMVSNSGGMELAIQDLR